MKTLKLKRMRSSSSDGVMGVLTVFDEDGFPLFSCITLERSWAGNKPNVSCIPAGMYPVRLEHSPKFKRDLWEVKYVQGRSEIKFHAANKASELQGCVAPGLAQYPDHFYITRSGDAMALLHATLSPDKEATLIIR